MRATGTLFIIALASALAACNSGGAGTQSPTGNTLAAGCNRAGSANKYTDMGSYAGHSLADRNLLAAPQVAARLQQLPADARKHLEHNLAVSQPIRLVGCHLVLLGNAARMRGKEDALLDVNLFTGDVIAAVHSGDHTDIYPTKNPDAQASEVEYRWLPLQVRQWAALAEMDFPSQFPPGSRLHIPDGSPDTEGEKAASPMPQSSHPVKPTPAQATAIRRATGTDFDDCTRQHKQCYDLFLGDLNDDGRPDLFIGYTTSDFCGSAGCASAAVLATKHGYASKAISLAYGGPPAILYGKHHGMHDLRYYGDSPVWQWNGREYDIERDSPLRFGAGAPPWQTREAGGHTLALAAAVNSTIRTVSVFCNEGKPLLAMLMKLAPPAGPFAVTWVFNGRTVTVPMQQANPGATLWTADLSDSQLPLYLARSAGTAYLRNNSGIDADVSLEHSSATTEAALRGCYHY